ncbi:hypothetical protein BT63DRAFT_410341 [Microthyrium microscopicum]|uniref:Uncharacterized protein n=1 Tax=Microthyrium microscopicum TaxID=703497 RepID=A0A6A6UNG3_9PEZI|nr:hypothetical protein BT63DRAFT_410341 [Microthyrium microscopicum]
MPQCKTELNQISGGVMQLRPDVFQEFYEAVENSDPPIPINYEHRFEPVPPTLFATPEICSEFLVYGPAQTAWDGLRIWDSTPSSFTKRARGPFTPCIAIRVPNKICRYKPIRSGHRIISGHRDHESQSLIIWPRDRETTDIRGMLPLLPNNTRLACFVKEKDMNVSIRLGPYGPCYVLVPVAAASLVPDTPTVLPISEHSE